MKGLLRRLQRFFFGINLQNKFIGLFLPLVVIPLSLLGTFSYYKSSEVVLNQVCQTILENLSQVNYSLNYFVKDIEQLTMYIYSNREIQDVLSKDKNRSLAEKQQDRKKMQDILDSLLGFKNWDISIYLMGENGDRYFTSDLLPSQYDEFNVNWGLFRRMRLGGGNVVWDTHYNMKKTDDFGIVLSSGRLLKRIDTNQPIGYAAIDIMESALADKYNKAHLENGGQVLLLDRNGYVISSTPYKHQIGTKLDAPYVEQVLKGIKGYFKLTLEDGADGMVVYDTSELTGFKLISIVPVTSLSKASLSIRNLTLFGISLGFIISCWLAYILALNITKPLRKLRWLMFEVESGNLNVAFSSKYRDEVGQLGLSFNAMVLQIKQLIDEVYKKQLMVQEAEIKAIQAQFNPHFLYNALDSINWMARIHKLDNISKTAISLGELLRFSIRKGNPFIPIREDIQQIHNFLFILKMRYGDKFDADIEMEDGIEQLYTLKLLFQPIVENAVTHGLEMKLGKGLLQIKGTRAASRIRFEIRDNGVGIVPEVLEHIRSGQFLTSSSEKTGIGLENLRKRLELYFGNDFCFDIESVYGEGTIVIVEIPIMTQAGGERLV
ncbi:MULTISPECIES: cache domain-containing sensor histidine kinase [unclassified Paenibacillus]|uniref:cache domain-containing sensor histidine kinase n=1 Tax=unclassified Paenibacillus TaxID=185978 RepID=UPI00362E4D6F